MSDLPQKPDRASLRMRDMIGAVVVLLLIIGAVLAFYGGCEFSPGGPTVDPDTAPSADASGELERAARSAAFAVREPDVPDGWRPNSTSTTAVGAGATASVVVRVGYVTTAGAFLQLSQSGGDAGEVVAKETGQAEPPAATGTVDVGGVTWTTYPGRRDEDAWVADLDGVVMLVTGSAREAEFRQLATAAQEAAPLPR
ncbi:DUF4245 domain-containing protein [Actinophytocola algeriensis]|uniref:DUF4245 domain-containing protein n=1 Tax=Actinophytocola algeriensis TaxID=1768010 RepID=A0A7W7QED7_9PSEU|nr:DUF4245 domain-containing protein [Actinophytocola algeriensis]MBB4911918.1 hypothetical protein [Actinophytocola algeriensis]MBE1477590.1 hypothetical protein [Actinophytocola algeriensis]